MGGKIKFIHLSDIHMLKDYAGDMMEPVVSGGKTDPAELLRGVLEYIALKYSDIDFIMITGDLTHEGDAEDYALFREIIEGRRCRVPVFVTLGNHDETGAFWDGYMGAAPVNDEYYYFAEINGFRVIALDSNCGKGGQGEISMSQMEWLKGILCKRAQNGSILLLHHPAVVGLTEDALYYCLKNAGELYDAIQGSDILAIFSGHKHRDSVTMLGGIPQFTADSIGYGVEFDEYSMRITDRHGYSYCVIEDGQVYVTHERFPHTSHVVAETSMDELMEQYLRRNR